MPDRVRRKLVKLWHYRRETVFSKLYAELDDCRRVLLGGLTASKVSKYLGGLGMLHWLRDGKGTEAQWRAWRHDLREYATTRSIVLEARIARVEDMPPPSVPEPQPRPGCSRCTRGFIRCHDPECAVCASDNDPDCPDATRCPNCNPAP